ncbi:MAG: hypothetical protein ACRDRK_22415 [Pseudonocardia sp.]
MNDLRSVPLDESALLAVTLRLARLVEQQAQQLRRMRDDEQRIGRGDGVVAAGLRDLERTAHRISRDGERLRLLCGADPGSATRSVTLSEVLGEAAAATEEPSRITVRVAPVTTVEGRAAAELRHVLAALLDHAMTSSGPGRDLIVSCRLGPAGLAVDIVVGGEPWDLLPLDSGLADALARHTATGIGVERPLAGQGGLLATVYCPAAAVIVPAEPRSPNGAMPVIGRGEGSAMPVIGRGEGPAMPVIGRGDGPAMQAIGRSARPAGPIGGDALFGPIRVPSGPVDDGVGTPIFEAVASAWFQEIVPAVDPATVNGWSPARNGNRTALDWESPGDEEWRAAAARAARPDTGMMTAAGLPQRRPGDQLIAPPLGGSRQARVEPEGRVPDRVRDRLNTYQRGLRQGRHRAAEPSTPESDGWWAEPTA